MVFATYFVRQSPHACWRESSESDTPGWWRQASRKTQSRLLFPRRWDSLKTMKSKLSWTPDQPFIQSLISSWMSGAVSSAGEWDRGGGWERKRKLVIVSGTHLLLAGQSRCWKQTSFHWQFGGNHSTPLPNLTMKAAGTEDRICSFDPLVVLRSVFLLL